MFAVLSALVALGCVLASVRRFVVAVSSTWLDPTLLVGELRARGEVGWESLRAAIRECPRATWERDLAAAFDGTPSDRAGLVNEQLRELDWRAGRWARAPRVCASVATNAGFLCGCGALLQWLDDPSPDKTAGLSSALAAVAIGVAGASFCVAVHLRCRRIVRDRVANAGRLVECIEALNASRIVAAAEQGGSRIPAGEHRRKPACM